MLSRRDFEKIQRETGFNLDLLEKVYHLTRILYAIQQEELLSKNLTLKGGTALQFLYLGLSRLSIDIDLNYTGSIAKEDMLEIRPSIEKSIINLGQTLRYNVKERDSSYILSRHSFQYSTIRNTKDHIKIEINYLDRLPLGINETKKFPLMFPDIPIFSVATYSLEELIAQKTKASIERSEPRDTYDLYCLSKQNTDINKTRTYATVYYCMSKPEKLTDIIKKIREFDLEKIRQEIRQFIRSDEKLDAEKIRNNAADFMKLILSFTDDEKKFIEAFYKERKIIPEFLFKEKSKLEGHPTLLHMLHELEMKRDSKRKQAK